MIKFTASGKDTILVGLGLEPENIKRMQQGQPVRVRLKDLGFSGPLALVQIMLFTGKDVESMKKDLAPFIDDQTVIHEEPR